MYCVPSHFFIEYKNYINNNNKLQYIAETSTKTSNQLSNNHQNPLFCKDSEEVKSLLPFIVTF